MILVDSSVWIDFFRGKVTTQAAYLDQALRLAQTEIAIADLILLEILQGFRSHEEASIALSSFNEMDCVELGGKFLAVRAARNFRQLRQKGVTIRSTIDCMIATFCIEEGIPLLHNDRDFDPFEQHLGLQVIRA
jgi:predicted nucleic acid-binding protein